MHKTDDKSNWYPLPVDGNLARQRVLVKFSMYLH